MKCESTHLENVMSESPQWGAVSHLRTGLKCEAHGMLGAGAWLILFSLRSAVMGDLLASGAQEYNSVPEFTSDRLTLVGFNSIILLFVFNLSMFFLHLYLPFFLE